MGRVASFVAASILATSAALHAQTADSDFKEFVQQFEAAYNRGDVQALAGLHTDTAIRLGSDGRALAGGAEIEKDMAAALTGPRKGSRAAIQLGRSQVLKPDVALIDGTYEVTGGGTPVRGRYLITLLRENGQWRIASISTVSAPTNASR